LMKPANLERSQTILPFWSRMTPSFGKRAIRPRLAFAKSALSDQGSEAVEFLLNSRVDGDAGLESLVVEAVCAATLRGAASNPVAAVAAVKQITSRRFRFELNITTSVSPTAAVLLRGCKIERRKWYVSTLLPMSPNGSAPITTVREQCGNTQRKARTPLINA
jgi:hypothetical protein